MSDQKAIGPSFEDELIAKGGLIGQHFTWFPDGTIEFFDDTPEDVKEGVLAVYAAHDPTKESLAQLESKRAALLADANSKTLGMADAFVAGILTDAQAATFKAWAAYKFALGKLDLSAVPVAWPVAPA